jgi:tRNA pseudouridine38-40 synthase
MSRYFIEIAYKGTNYHGWQIQENANSVQAETNKAISTLLQEKIVVTGAGRTDTGVHAKQLFAHFDYSAAFDTSKFLYKINNFLPDDISCKSLEKVDDEKHARFSAISRTYEYRITNTKNPFLIDSAYFFPHHLDVKLMNAAAKELLKFTDFSCFSKSNTDTFTNDCEITEAFWREENKQLIFTISSNRFLRNMVRAIVGTLIEIGQRKIQLDDIEKIVNSKDRGNAGQSVPAHGLYLTGIKY